MNRAILCVFLLYYSALAQAESGCDSIVINHQSDLDSIRNCKEYGDIKIGHRFTGDLEIRDVFRFSALTNEICQDCDSEDATAAITSLKVSDDVTIDQFYSGYDADGFTIRNVGLESLDFIFTGRGARDTFITISDIPNVHNISWTLRNITRAVINGNGNLTFAWNYTNTMFTKAEVGELVLSGVNYTFIPRKIYVEETTDAEIGSLTVRDSNLEVLDLVYTKISSLTLENNPNLKTVRGFEWPGMRMNNVTILANPQLGKGKDPLNHTRSNGIDEFYQALNAQSGWIWPYWLINVVIHGPVHNDFL
ncbi:hypothetical protein K4F52_004014 [Lecanicillium sp. MT-2017a]|nr:hypothetical protein K4F52_004014 [Lecanicillium sp. MT-2017a]